MSHPVVEIRGLARSFGRTVAVDHVDLSLTHGEVVSVLGPSGSGKTTLLHLLAGHLKPDAGTIDIDGRRVAGPRTWVAPEHRRIGMVFQDYALFPHLTVAENVGFALGKAMCKGVRTRRILVNFGLDELQDRYPHELSGGQQQRVALARALSTEPQLLLCDEAFSSLDSSLREQVRSEILSLLRASGHTCVFVTHDQEEALSISDRIAVMDRGRILQFETPEAIYRQPSCRWVAEFVGKMNVLPGVLSGDIVTTEVGSFEASCHRDGPVEVLVRPELLDVRPDPDGEALVVNREFRGHDVFYTLQLDSGRTLFAHRPSVLTALPGQRVTIIPQPGVAIVVDDLEEHASAAAPQALVSLP